MERVRRLAIGRCGAAWVMAGLSTSVRVMSDPRVVLAAQALGGGTHNKAFAIDMLARHGHSAGVPAWPDVTFAPHGGPNWRALLRSSVSGLGRGRSEGASKGVQSRPRRRSVWQQASTDDHPEPPCLPTGLRMVSVNSLPDRLHAAVGSAPGSGSLLTILPSIRFSRFVVRSSGVRLDMPHILHVGFCKGRTTGVRHIARGSAA